MNHDYSGGKRQREAERLQKQKEKAERLRRNREMRRSTAGGDEIAAPMVLPEVKLEDVVLTPPPRPKRGTVGPVKLFVGGLSWNTDTEALRNGFAKFGPLVEVQVIQDRDTGRSRGFGFVTFENAKDAEDAIKAMSGAQLDGRTLKVNRAEAR